MILTITGSSHHTSSQCMPHTAFPPRTWANTGGLFVPIKRAREAGRLCASAKENRRSGSVPLSVPGGTSTSEFSPSQMRSRGPMSQPPRPGGSGCAMSPVCCAPAAATDARPAAAALGTIRRETIMVSAPSCRDPIRPLVFRSTEKMPVNATMRGAEPHRDSYRLAHSSRGQRGDGDSGSVPDVARLSAFALLVSLPIFLILARSICERAE
jgi:hypothetical protein